VDSRDTRHNIFVKIVIGYVVFGLLAIEIPYFFILCRPFTQYWAFPVSNPQCANYFYYCIIQMVFNISTDLLMLLIPIPFMVNARVPPIKRAMLVGIFSLGIFVILAAILNKYYNFTEPNTTVYMVWDIRETSVAIYVANIMCWWPLLRKLFGWSTFLRSGSNSGQSGRDSGAFNLVPEPAVMRRETIVGRDPHERKWDEEAVRMDHIHETPDLKTDWPLKSEMKF
jgi:hypothetical protein